MNCGSSPGQSQQEDTQDASSQAHQSSTLGSQRSGSGSPTAADSRRHHSFAMALLWGPDSDSSDADDAAESHRQAPANTALGPTAATAECTQNQQIGDAGAGHAASSAGSDNGLLDVGDEEIDEQGVHWIVYRVDGDTATWKEADAVERTRPGTEPAGATDGDRHGELGGESSDGVTDAATILAPRTHPRTPPRPPDKKFPCELCPAWFARSDNRDRHRRAHGGEQPHRCERCTSRFTSRDSLKRHLRAAHAPAVTNKKPHACGLCGQRFANRSNRNRHHAAHAGKKPHACGLCSARFERPCSLTTHHQYRHTDEKPHACTYCGKGFKTDGKRVRHERTHAAA